METEHYIRVERVNQERRIVYGVVYEPDTLDFHGEFMRRGDIEKLAHRFMQMDHLSQSIDTMHDSQPNGSVPVESFIAREGDPEYPEGAWVLGVHVSDDDVWKAVVDGELNGFSFSALAKRIPTAVEIDIPRDHFLKTAETDNHSHVVWVEMSDDGVVVAGRTSTDGAPGREHSHNVMHATATEKSRGHSHRITL